MFNRMILCQIGRATGLLLALIVALLAAAVPAQARSTDQLEVCVARQSAGDTPGTVLASPHRFSCGTRQSDWGPGDYWIKFVLPDTVAPQDATGLVFTPNLQANADLYMRGEGGILVRIPLDEVSISRRTQIGAQIEIPIEPAALADGAILMRIDGAVNPTGMLKAPRLIGHAIVHGLELREMAVYAAFAGLCIALLVYNLVLWFTMRERFLLTYCGTVLAMLGYVGLHSGVLDILMPEIGAATRMRLNYFALGALAVLSIRFIADFLPPNSLPRWLKILLGLSSAAILAASMGVLLAPHGALYLLDRLYVGTFLPIPAIAVAMCWFGWRHDRDSVRVLVLAWTLPVIMSMVRILHAFNLIGDSILVEHSVTMAMSSEALLSSLAMSLRVRHIVSERDMARVEESAARRLSEIDPLTGLQNRRALLANATNMSPGEELRLLLVDIDFFKSINDTYGHGVGDEVLSEVASILARSLEIRGTVARLGGEEFALLGPAADIPEDLPHALLSNIRIAEMPEGIRITVSIGIADGLVDDESGWRDLYRRADTALYDAKRSGRNCFKAAPATGPSRNPGIAAA